MSDRIVVMSKGRIEQVGTPDEVYGKPASPFVADFVGRMNFLDGRLISENRALCSGAELTFSGAMTYAAETPVTVCVRPEDVVVRNINGTTANVFDVDVGIMEFVGNHFATMLHVNGTNLNLSADLSMNDVRDLGVKPGATIAAMLPVERLRVFAAAAR